MPIPCNIIVNPSEKPFFKAEARRYGAKNWLMVTEKADAMTLASRHKMRRPSIVLLAGDAGSFIDPITGEDIYYVLKTGRYSAEAVTHAHERNDESAALTRYEQLLRGEFSTRVYSPGYVFQHFMNNAWFVDTSCATPPGNNAEPTSSRIIENTVTCSNC